jgi:hypothetical protein
MSDLPPLPTEHPRRRYPSFQKQKCEACDKWFDNSSNLTVHKFICGKPRGTTHRFFCSACHKGFTAAGSKRRHEKAKHGIQSGSEPAHHPHTSSGGSGHRAGSSSDAPRSSHPVPPPPSHNPHTSSGGSGHHAGSSSGAPRPPRHAPPPSHNPHTSSGGSGHHAGSSSGAPRPPRHAPPPSYHPHGSGGGSGHRAGSSSDAPRSSHPVPPPPAPQRDPRMSMSHLNNPPQRDPPQRDPRMDMSNIVTPPHHGASSSAPTGNGGSSGGDSGRLSRQQSHRIRPDHHSGR